jgi:hypothetical protein
LRISYIQSAQSAVYSGISLLGKIKAIDVFFKKVSLKNITNPQQQFCVYGRSVEYLIDICAIAVELAS